MTNTEELKRRISESGYKLEYIVKSLGLTYPSLKMKIENVTEFKASEIAKLCEVLHIDADDMKRIFFALEVEEKETEVTA